MNSLRTLAALAAALLLPLAAFAADETQTVLSTGTGDTIDSAKKDAYREAVQQVVGQLVDSDILVENDNLVNDRILTYSAAYVEGAEVIGNPERTADGLFRVRIRARVRKTALEQKVREIKPATAEVSGEDIYARLVSSADQHEDGSDMIADLFDNVRAKLVKVETVAGRNGKDPIDIDPATKELFVNVRVSIDKDAYRRFLKDVAAKLRPMCIGILRAKKDAGRLANRPVRSRGGNAATSTRYAHEARAKGVGALLVLPEANAETATLITFDNNTFSRIAACAGLGNLSVRVSVLDADGDVIRRKTMTVAEEQRLSRECFPGNCPWKDTPTVWLAPVIQAEQMASGQDAFFFNVWMESKTVKVPLGRFSPDEARLISCVEAALDGEHDELF